MTMAMPAEHSEVVIRGGRVISASAESRTDILCRDGRVVALGTGLESAGKTIEAGGFLILPGGVDAHTHLEHDQTDPRTGLRTWTADDFLTGSRAAVSGGTTTIIDFVKAGDEGDLFGAFEERRNAAAQKSVADFGFHAIVTDAHGDARQLADLERLVREGVTSFKLFLAYPGRLMVGDDVIIAAMREARRLGALTMVHAENGHMIADATSRLVDAGRTDEALHLAAHPEIAELEATERAIRLAEYVGVPLFVVHVSSARAGAAISEARLRGSSVSGETCPQYLFTCAEDYETLQTGAAAYICSPPIRNAKNGEALWKLLTRGGLTTVGSDHACYRLENDVPELGPQKPRGHGDFRRVPNGVPGAQERLPLLVDAALRGEMSLSRVVDVTSSAPASVFGLGTKGAIAPGYDADLVIVDPDGETTFTGSNIHSRAGYSLYAKTRLKGKIVQVLRRGACVFNEGLTDMASPGTGKYVRREEVGRDQL